ncbi:MAG: serine/threonine protein kinase [Proteobacteria bacterium]|nr:serine/threonine protein kinase [Pseudomonadota bacterium]
MPQQSWYSISELDPGTQLGPYSVMGELGRGGGGVLYCVEDTRSGQFAAMKVLSHELAEKAKNVRRFLQEVRAINLIGHPNIVETYDVGTLPDDRPYYIMELLDGNDLSQELLLRGRMSPQQALEILEPLSAALHAAHEAGVIHRDVKCSNIFLAEATGKRIVKLLDFGIAKLIDGQSDGSTITTIGRVLGTPHVMAPEQLKGFPVDRRVDVYALGIVAYRLVTGKLPFRGNTPAALAQLHLSAEPIAPSSLAPVPKAIDGVIARGLAKTPEARYEDAMAFLDAFRCAVSGESARRAPAMAEAIAIYLDLRIAETDDGDEVDEELLDDLWNIIDTSERTLLNAGLRIALQTETATLAVFLTPASRKRADAAMSRMRNLAWGLYEILQNRPTPDPRVHINMCIRRDRALVLATAHDPEGIAGPVLDVRVWAPRENMHGVVESTSSNQ